MAHSSLGISFDQREYRSKGQGLPARGVASFQTLPKSHSKPFCVVPHGVKKDFSSKQQSASPLS